MNAKTEGQQPSSDKLKWTLVFVLLVLAIAGNWYMGSNAALDTLPLQSTGLLATRIVGVVVLVVLALLVAWTTTKGKATISFAKESRLEIRKVVWPTRQEAVQTTLIVIAITCLMGFLMFVIDGALVWIIGHITGVKG
ncbi:preprotein translocase subunit SecE [Dongshaea marina]|uniref:preprotein translocase subunit SecE n=1 Tax=Dongshaea marina TaxID=2047966 RepID=UPI000D3E0C66|nr:preprotein translocase subunit SecE [Dongshaea marina]